MDRKTRRFFVLGMPAAVSTATLLCGRSADAAPSAGRARKAPTGPRVRTNKGPSATKARPKARGKVTPARVDASIVKKAKHHRLRAANVVRARGDIGVAANKRTIKLVPKGMSGLVKIKPRLDVAAFGQALHDKFATTTTGYAMQLRRNGGVTYNLLWEWSRTPTDGGQGWSFDTRMHIASVSKLLTAMAMVHALNFRNKDIDDKIAPYLPKYWARGARVEDLTFRHLLRHTTGFRGGGSASDFGFMKSKVAAGVSTNFGMYGYHNMNFGLCRILIPVLFGWINPNDTHGSATDHIWDIRTTTRFREYCNTNIFAPAGVHNVGFKPGSTHALAYRRPHAGVAGWNSGDLTTASGGVGFRMSVNEVIAVLGEFRRGGSIVSKAEAQTFLDRGLGIDQRIETPAGWLYNKNGSWADSDTNPRQEQAVAYFMPEGMELVAFVNSPIAGGGSLRGIIADTYAESLTTA